MLTLRPGGDGEINAKNAYAVLSYKCQFHTFSAHLFYTIRDILDLKK